MIFKVLFPIFNTMEYNMNNTVSVQSIRKKFDILENEADGDCLFRSMSQLFFDNEDGHDLIRSMIYDYYCSFDIEKDYNENSKEFMIKLSIITDSGCEDEDELPHHINISKQGVWGNMTDILVASIVFDCDFIILKTIKGSKYTVLPIISKFGKKNIYHIRHVKNNHYEALINKK